MTAVLLDTQAWVWSLMGSERLTQTARQSIHRARRVLVSPITFFEITQKVRLGKWPDMEPFVDELPDILKRQGGSIALLNSVICIQAGRMIWHHRDPFDRLIAATALHLKTPLISTDSVFDGMTERIW